MSNYDEIALQNITLYNTIQNAKEMYSSDFNKQIYEDIKYKKIQYGSTVMFYIYYGLFFIFVMILLFISKSKWYIKCLIIAIFAAYPFLIYLIENFFYELLAFVLYYA